MTLPTVKRRYLSARKGYTALAMFMIVRVVTIARLIYQGRSKEASEASEALDKQDRRFQQRQGNWTVSVTDKRFSTVR